MLPTILCHPLLSTHSETINSFSPRHAKFDVSEKRTSKTHLQKKEDDNKECAFMFPSPLYYGSVSLSFSSSLSSAPPLFSAQQQRRNQRKRENNGLSFCASLPPDDKGHILNRFESIQERVVERNKRRLRGTVNANYAASATNRGCYFVASSAAAMSSDDEKNVKLYKLTLAACLSMLAFGAACGCIAGALVYVDFGTPSSVVLLSSKVKGAIVAALPLGAATACLAIGSKSASERFGRRDIFRFANVLYLFSAALASLSNSYTMLIVARFIAGLACGCSTGITTVFISECVPAKTRGKYTSLSPLFGTIGLLYAFVMSLVIASLFAVGDLNAATNVSGEASSFVWRLMLLVPILPCFAQEYVFRFMPDVCPESPRWLASRGRYQEARLIMESLGQTLPSNNVASLAISDARPIEDSGFFGLFKSAKHIKATGVACGMNMLQQFCGINVIVYYAPKILNSLGYGKRESILLTVIVSMFQICFGTYLSQKIDVYGRKKMAMIGICGIISGCALLSFSFSTAGGSASPGLMAILGILIFRVSFSLSLGPIPYVVSSEVFAKDARSSGVALATLVQWLCNVLVTFTFLSFVDAFGAGKVFVAYTFVGILALASVYYLLPETNQQKLEDN